MAGMFYSLQEAAEKLNMTEEQIKEVVKQGRLREFRDGPNLLFKVDEVEALLSDIPVEPSAEPEAVPEEVEEELITLDEADTAEGVVSAEGSTITEQTPSIEKTGEEELALSPEPDSTSAIAGDLSSADTLSDEGVDLLDETEVGEQVREKTRASAEFEGLDDMSLGEIGEDVNLDTFGSGSGLLDLSLQADDTSLGGILNEIYTAEGEGEQPAEEASVEEVAAEAEEMLPSEEAPMPQAGVMTPGYVEVAADSSSNTFGYMLFLPLLMVIYTGIVVVAGLFDVMPVVVEKTRGIILYVLGGTIVAAGIMAVMGFMAGTVSTGAGKVKKPKAKKEKKPKVKKEKKPKAKKEKK